MWGYLGGLEGGEIVFRIYCMTEESVFNEKERKDIVQN